MDDEKEFTPEQIKKQQNLKERLNDLLADSADLMCDEETIQKTEELFTDRLSKLRLQLNISNIKVFLSGFEMGVTVPEDLMMIMMAAMRNILRSKEMVVNSIIDKSIKENGK